MPPSVYILVSPLESVGTWLNMGIGYAENCYQYIMMMSLIYFLKPFTKKYSTWAYDTKSQIIVKSNDLLKNSDGTMTAE